MIGHWKCGSAHWFIH